MSDRLRRLDRLFAERVLGYTTQHFAVIHSGTSNDGWALTGKPKGGDILLPYPRPLPHYTRSLDAAWEAVPRMYEVSLHWQGGCVAQIRYAVEIGIVEAADHADHPAEALVLACLRAVGCSEEELNEGA